MDCDTRVDRYETEHFVAHNRIATLGQLIVDLADTVVDHQRITRGSRVVDFGRIELGGVDRGSRRATLLVSLATQVARDDLLDLREVDLLVQNSVVKLCSCTDFQRLTQIDHRVVDGDVHLPILQLSLQLLASQTCLTSLLLAQELTDFVAGLGGCYNIEPIRLGGLILLGEDLDDVAIAQHLADRNIAVIDLCAGAGATHIRVDIECKIEHRRTLGQLAQVALGREDKDFTRGGLGVESLHQRVGRGLHQFAQTTEPLLAGLCALIDTLVTPVGGNTSLGHFVHSLGANLHLDPTSLLGYNRSMQ